MVSNRRGATTRSSSYRTERTVNENRRRSLVSATGEYSGHKSIVEAIDSHQRAIESVSQSVRLSLEIIDPRKCTIASRLRVSNVKYVSRLILRSHLIHDICLKNQTVVFVVRYALRIFSQNYLSTLLYDATQRRALNDVRCAYARRSNPSAILSKRISSFTRLTTAIRSIYPISMREERMKSKEYRVSCACECVRAPASQTRPSTPRIVKTNFLTIVPPSSTKANCDPITVQDSPTCTDPSSARFICF